MTWSQRSLSNLARSNFRGSSPSRSALRLLLVSSGSNTITAEGETPYSPVRLSSYLSSDELRHLNTTRSLPISKNASIITFSIMSPSTKSDSSKFSLPENFLASPAPNISTQNVNFLHTDLPQYNGFYATIIDNALSKEECIALVRAAEAQTDGKWEQAMINVGYGEQKLITDARDCGRIIWDDKGVVEKIWARVKGCVPEIEYIKNAPLVTGRRPAAKGETWKMTRLNERMRFLRYGEGQYFRRKPYLLLHPPPPPFFFLLLTFLYFFFFSS